jgi:hypothetical protein
MVGDAREPHRDEVLDVPLHHTRRERHGGAVAKRELRRLSAPCDAELTPWRLDAPGLHAKERRRGSAAGDGELQGRGTDRRSDRYAAQVELEQRTVHRGRAREADDERSEPAKVGGRHAGHDSGIRDRRKRDVDSGGSCSERRETEACHCRQDDGEHELSTCSLRL